MLNRNECILLLLGHPKKPPEACWSSRGYRRQRAIEAVAKAPGQTLITDFFDIKSLTNAIDSNEIVRNCLNDSCGKERSLTVRPILQRLIENAEVNACKSSLNSYRHNEKITKFASSLYCLIGKSSYELLQVNLGCALPSISTIQRSVGKTSRVTEGSCRYDELKEHLGRWKAPLAVHLALDDTRIVNKIDYDPVSGRFVGFCLPLDETGMPLVDAFCLETFEDIEKALESQTKAAYAHCIVAKSVSITTPMFVLFVMGTDSKYTHVEISKRWSCMERELQKRDIIVISYGSDGAGPFLKAMTEGSHLFTRDSTSNVPPEWSFYAMPTLSRKALYAQDIIHLLAKLRTRLITPSNLLALGCEVACRGHLTELLKGVKKEEHGLCQRTIDSKDKQNYSSIELLIRPCVTNCLRKLNDSLKVQGTIVYLEIMRDIRDAFFDRSISPLTRLQKLWRSLFVLRMWRCWLKVTNSKLDTHFVSTNAYICVEINAHMLLNLIFNVIQGILPVEALRIWYTGSQACEQLFRLLRSMTPAFSTIVNFSMQGMLNKIHKLEFISAAECDDEIVFPRVKRRLLQIKEESSETLTVPTLAQVTSEILMSKSDAIRIAKSCKMELVSYEDKDLLLDLNEVVHTAVATDHETDDVTSKESENTIVPTRDTIYTNEESIQIDQDLLTLKLRKTTKEGSLPTYELSASNSDGKKSKEFTVKGRSSFISYNGVYIRKVTALYLLQERTQLSNDRLLRVRGVQPEHVFTGETRNVSGDNVVSSGELCVFKRIDCPNYLLGRIVQFSYLQGKKRQRQFSGQTVELQKESCKNIGVFANWYSAVHPGMRDKVEFSVLSRSLLVAT